MHYKANKKPRRIHSEAIIGGIVIAIIALTLSTFLAYAFITSFLMRPQREVIERER